MNRRSFLSLLGLAPLAPVAVKAATTGGDTLAPGDEAVREIMTMRTYGDREALANLIIYDIEPVDFGTVWANIPVTDDWHVYDE